MNAIFAQLTTGWHLMRWIRLIVGLFAAVQMFLHKDLAMGIIAILFLFQAVTNTGCCGASCAMPPKEETKKTENLS